MRNYPKADLPATESSASIRGVIQYRALLCLSTFSLMLSACGGHGRHSSTELDQAIRSADPAAIQQILERGANPNMAQQMGETPLGLLIQQYSRSEAYRRQSIEMAATTMLKNGADPNGLHHGFTPLQIATGQGSELIVSRLITFGADPNLETKAGLAPLWQAAYDNNHRIGLILLKAGANPNAPNAQGQTPLEYLRSRGYSRTRLMLHLKYYGGH